MTEELFLHEELMLLALRDREGTIASGTMYTYAVGGAIVAQLVMAGRVDVEVRGRSKLIRVVDPAALGDPLLDEWLDAMAASKKRRPVSHWVSRIAGTRDLKHRVAAQLCRRGILRNEEDKILWIFTRKVYPELDPEPERELVRRLEAAIFEDAEVTPRSAVLTGIAQHSGILPAVFGKKRLEPRRARIAELAEGSAAVGATEEAIQAMQTAVLVAAVIPTVVVATTSSG